MADVISSSRLEEVKVELVAKLREIADKLAAEPDSYVLNWNIEYGLQEWAGDDNWLRRCPNGQTQWAFTVYIPSNDTRTTRKE